MGWGSWRQPALDKDLEDRMSLAEDLRESLSLDRGFRGLSLTEGLRDSLSRLLNSLACLLLKVRRAACP